MAVSTSSFVCPSFGSGRWRTLQFFVLSSSAPPFEAGDLTKISDVRSRNDERTQVYQQWLPQPCHESLFCMQRSVVLQQSMPKERLAESPQAAMLGGKSRDYYRARFNVRACQRHSLCHATLQRRWQPIRRHHRALDGPNFHVRIDPPHGTIGLSARHATDPLRPPSITRHG
jgi:hypothetical protein